MPWVAANGGGGGSGTLGGGRGSGMLGGGAGGGRPNTGIERRSVTPRCAGCACCLSNGFEGLWGRIGLDDIRFLRPGLMEVRFLGFGLTEARFPGIKEGVLDIRTGALLDREEDRKGA